MTEINLHEAKTHFSRYVKRALKGERIVVCVRNKPVLELKPLSPPPRKRRPIGLDKGRFKVPDDINEPLPDAPEVYVPDTRRRHGITGLPLSEAACLNVHRLAQLHRDPFDRLLVCQALTEGMTILTPDPEIRQYPVPTAW